jgi:hypothetical protein
MSRLTTLFQHIRDQEFLTWVNHKLPQYSKDPEEWEAMFALLMRRPEGCVFKDVYQVFFVKQFISQLRFNFHVIYLRRDLSEIVQCSERVGWDVSRLAQAQVELDRLFRPVKFLPMMNSPQIFGFCSQCYLSITR